MAYAGSPSDLAKQPAPATSSEPVGSWKPLVTAIVIVAIVLVAAISSAFLAGSNRVAPAGLSRAQIAGLQQSVAPAGLSRAQIAGLQQSVSRIVPQTGPSVRLPRSHR